jgi:hypothetical protein
MKSFLSLFTAVCCVGALSAQTTVLSEDFNANVVPPAGWTTQNLNGSISAGWVSDLNGQAYHADESGVGMCDNVLATPAMDLSGLTEAYLHMNTFMGYISYLDSQSVDVSTDGGVTWTLVWSDLGFNDVSTDVDISAYAGQASVMLGFHYVGDYAHNTLIDNVLVDDVDPNGGPPPPPSILSEDFDAGVVPPAGWTTQNLNGSISAGWVASAGKAYHADESGVGMCDDILATPAMDLSGYTAVTVTFNTFMGWVSYLDSQSLDVSTDGGATWTMVWSDLGMNNLEDTVDISAYAGQSSVMVGFHYVGDYAHSTTIDNVVVAEGGGGGGGLTYAITPMIAGSPATFSVTGADVNSNCIIGYSLLGAGPITTAYGVVDMTPPISRLPTLITDSNGDASLTLTVPANASGVTLYTQALANGVLTNSLAETVQ